MSDLPLEEQSLTPELVDAAYKFILGRATENETVRNDGVQYHKNLAAIRENIVATMEGKRALYELLFKHLPFTSIEVLSKRGFKININLADLGVSSEIFLFDEFETKNENIILEQINSNETFIDIGANIGWFTLIAAKKIADDWQPETGERGRVISFESNISTAKLLTGSVHSSPYRDFIDIYSIALSSDLGVFEFEDIHLGNISGAQTHNINQSLSEEIHVDILEKYRKTHDAFGDCQFGRNLGTSLDSLLIDHEQKIGFIKIDVEGSEPLVLDGAWEIIRKHKPKILIEFHKDKLMFTAGYTVLGLVEKIFKFDYSLYDYIQDETYSLSASEVEEIVNLNGYYDFLAIPNL